MHTDGALDLGAAIGVEVVTNATAVVRDGAEPQYAIEEVIPDASPLEEEFEKTFGVAFDNQTEVPIVLYEAADGDPSDLTPLAEVVIDLRDIGKDDEQLTVPRGTPVEVKLKYDKNGVITGRADLVLPDPTDPTKKRREGFEIKIERAGSRTQVIPPKEQAIEATGQ